VPALLTKVTRAREAAAAAEATRIKVVLIAETSTEEAAAARDGTALCVKDVEDRDTQAEREALEKVLRAKAEKAMALTFAHEDAEGLVQKITLLEGKLVEECQAREVAE
jgi:hypothetical protein